METINRKGYRINAKAKSAEVLIYDTIGEGWLGGISAKQFAEDLKSFKKVDELVVRINSEGGSVFDGNAIYNTLRNYGATISVKIDGLAASIASVIAMAGDTIEMAENGFLMIHDPWMVAGGTADELREQADLMDKVQEKLANTYVKKTGKELDEIDSLMKAETWMDANEALEMGFIDTITEETRMAACVHKGRYKNAPETLLEAPTPRSDKIRSEISTYIAASLKAKNM